MNIQIKPTSLDHKLFPQDKIWKISQFQNKPRNKYFNDSSHQVPIQNLIFIIKIQIIYKHNILRKNHYSKVLFMHA